MPMVNDGSPIGTRELECEKFGMGLTPVGANVLATGTGKTADNIITELQRLGLVTQS